MPLTLAQRQVVLTPRTSPELRQFLNRVASQDSAHQRMYRFVIDNLVQQNLWSKIDMLQWYAAAERASALTNLKSSSFGGTEAGTVSFAADRGYTGNGGNFHIVTSFTPSTAGGQLTLNSLHGMGYNRTSYTGGGADGFLFGTDHTAANDNGFHILPWDTGSSKSYFNLHGNDPSPYTNSSTSLPTNAQGMWVTSRTSSTAVAVYRNGPQFTTFTNTATALSDRPIWSHTYNDGSANGFGPSTYQIAAIGCGGALTAAEASIYNFIVNQGMKIVGASVF